MAIERDSPSKASIPPQGGNQRLHQPEFGSPSPLRSALPKVFNMPTKGRPRPEHHRPSNSGIGADDGLRKHHAESAVHPINKHPSPLQPSNSGIVADGELLTSGVTSKLSEPPRLHKPIGVNDGAGLGFFNQRYDVPSNNVQEIPRPANVAFPMVRPSERPTFSSLGGTNGSFTVVNRGLNQKAPIDLTGGNRGFNGISSGGADQFGAIDTDAYINPTKTAETIKALLEGAFDDDDGKPRTRSRKKKQEMEVVGLVDKLKDLNVRTKGKANGENNEDEEEDEEDEEEDDGTVEGLNVKLLPHQVQGVQWMREKEGGKPKGGILADDMGLGKTLQSIALILTNPLQSGSKSSDEGVQKSTLVVAPLALIKQWENEIKDRVSRSHRLRVYIHHGPSRTKNYLDLQRYDVVITTYQILASEHANSSTYEHGVKVGCFGVYWYRVILDEAHSIKNHLAKSSKACYALRAKHRWCLTGTPMQNNLDELQSLIHFLQIKPYDDSKVWKEQITKPMKNGRGGTAIKRLQYFLKAVMKRRTKDILKKDGALNHGGKVSKEGEQSAFKVTERRIEEIKATFSVEERKFYDRLEQRTERSLEEMEGGGKISYANALVLLLRLRQACNHPELVAGKLDKDKDALAVSNGAGKVSAKPKVSSKEVDDVADLLGGLTVENTNCEVCLSEISKKEVANGAIRCSDCEDDVVRMRAQKKSRDTKGKRKVDTTQPRNRTIKHRPRVIDSDDEEEANSQDAWVVPEKQRNKGTSSKAGHTDDEDAESGGEWIEYEDMSVPDESDSGITKPTKHKQRRAIPLDTSDEDSASEEDEEDEEEDDEEGFSSSDEADLSSLVLSTKTECLLKILHKETAKHKFIVFSQFTSMLDLIEPFLRRDGFNYTRYDGSMRNDQREASLNRLRNSPKCRILLCSLKCGSLGLNLTAASRVVILEPFWNPFVEEQAIDRVHRLTQTVDVIVYKITIERTVEERILNLQSRKRELAKQAIEGKAVGKLSMKDIMSLFRHDHQGPPDANDISLSTNARLLGGGSGNGGSSVMRADVAGRQGVRKTSHPIGQHNPQGAMGGSVWDRRWD
ncbi:MAG: hypothetical protein M1839_009326 [Geoglossum umbratile]|nr:MAG: hypothetical protein M1839_009326 [Geoglossum umbratile]